MNQSSTKITSDNTWDINDSEKNNIVNAIKEQVATIKENSNQRSEKSKNQVSKPRPEKSHIEIIGDSILNGIHERGMNKDEKIKVKIRKYPGTSSIDILDHIKPSLRKTPEQIIIHAGTNDISNNTNYLKNV